VTILSYDTFTGTDGTFLDGAHTSDSGATWSLSPASSGTSGDLQLNSGTATKGSGRSYNGGYLYSYVPTGDYYIEVVVNIANASGEFQLISSTGSTIVVVNSFYTALVGAGSGWGAATVGVTYTLRLEVVSGVYTYKRDGVTINTWTYSDPPYYDPPYGILLGGTINQTLLYNFEIGTAGPPPPPPVFWTSFVGSYEVP
jgi:hypothetical protein